MFQTFVIFQKILFNRVKIALILLRVRNSNSWGSIKYRESKTQKKPKPMCITATKKISKEIKI